MFIFYYFYLYFPFFNLNRFRFLKIFFIFLQISLIYSQYAHRAVLDNAANEARLPAHLKNPFYRTPRVREALAHHSWFGPGEKVVHQRKADSIPRSEIYTVLAHAGFIPRNNFFHL